MMNNKTTRFVIFHNSNESELEEVIDCEFEVKNAGHIIQDPRLFYVAHLCNVALNKYGFHIKYVGEDDE